ncbi:histone acetylation protein-domain-containing protein [Kalaharituber pfeilii]|nr:histone acetylation protein-domain-containing protein [Kalaharituber pfeilii]
MPPPPSLQDRLSALLPADLPLTLYHVSHPPVKAADPLYLPPPGQPALPTTLESHFLAVAHDGILVFAIEVLIYVCAFKNPQTNKSHKETTFFVSKADSSGYLPSAAASFVPKNNADLRESTLRTISSTFLEHIITTHRTAHLNIRKSTISLFARSQAQYLFPDSASNKKKHVLDDRGLIRWWCRVLDPILQHFSDQDCAENASAYLLVPGLDKYETSALFPPKTRQAAIYPNAKRWVHGHPLKVDPVRHLTVREVIPHFPDDPKSRFLDELDAEYIGGGSRDSKKGKTLRGNAWANIKTLEQFWELMSFRQECSAGQSTGFIWIAIERAKKKTERVVVENTATSTTTGQVSGQAEPTSEITHDEDSIPPASQASQADTESTPPSASQAEPEADRTPSSSQQEAPSQHPSSVTSATAPKPITNPLPSLRLTSLNYKKVLETLLCSDFSTEPLARLHSRKWIDGALLLLGNGPDSTRIKEHKSTHQDWDWGVPVLGKREVVAATEALQSPTTQASIGTTVNVLSVRKKKRSDDTDAGGSTAAKAEGGMNVLEAGTMRKRMKMEELQTVPLGSTPVVPVEGDGPNMLAPGLMRKKPKPNTVPQEDTATAAS